MNLAELLHLCSLSSRTGKVNFTSTEKKGEIYLEEGEPCYAQYEQLQGDNALLKMLTRKQADTVFIPELYPPEKNVTLKTEAALLEAARLSDEMLITSQLSLKTSSQPKEKPRPAIANLYLLPDSTGWTYPILEGQQLYIGRDPKNEICIEHETISNRHCQLKNQSNSVVLTDSESLNGTFVNGKRIKMVVLSNHDLIQLGDATFRIEMK
ncbi:MAG: FHA domain-containing protein [Verrucomicrobiota bacterium]